MSPHTVARQLFSIRPLCLVGAGLLAVACEKPAASPPPKAPPETPEPGFAGVATPSPSPTAATQPAELVSTPQEINTNAEDTENRAVRAEVLKRIDVMPNLGQEEKDKLYVQVERAQAMGKVITIPFASGAHTVAPASLAGISKALTLPQVMKFSGDPTVVFVVLGYADKKGDPKANQAISLQRAEAVADVLQNKVGVMNVVRAVGMGGSEMFDTGALDKNRVVEVWVVLP